MARLHQIGALIFVIVFLGTGLYMRLNFPRIYEGDATMHMMFRSAHIYILLSALINAVMGVYFVPRDGWRRTIQMIGSTMLILSPAVFTLAFFFEPAPQRLDRPLALLGVVTALGGTISHVVAGWCTKTTAI